MEAKHTPGPWEAIGSLVRSRYGTNEEGVGGGGFLVADCSAIGMPGTDNARLIAAAPELLDALLEMTENYCELCREEGRNGDCEKFPEESEHPIYPACENVKRAKKAIAKAKGEA